AGASMGLGRGLAGSIAWRTEGMPRYDLIGRSDGFRRPGLEMFIEPGVSYSIGRSTWSFNVPIGIYRNRKPDAYTGLLGDATFPKAIVLASYSMRFGGLPQFRRPATPITASRLPDPGPGRATVGLDIAGMTC